MLKILTEDDSNVITTTAITEFTPADWEILIPALVRKMRDFEKVHWCLELRDFKQHTEELLLEDNPLNQYDSTPMERIAIIAEREWRGWAEDLLAPFSSAEIHFFENNKEEEAHRWLSS